MARKREGHAPRAPRTRTARAAARRRTASSSEDSDSDSDAEGAPARRPRVPAEAPREAPVVKLSAHDKSENAKARRALWRLGQMSGLGREAGLVCCPLFCEAAAAQKHSAGERRELFEYAPSLHAVARHLLKRQFVQADGTVRAARRPTPGTVVRPRVRCLAGRQEAYWLCVVHTAELTAMTFLAPEDLAEWGVPCPEEPEGTTLDSLVILLAEASRLDAEVLGPARAKALAEIAAETAPA